MFIGRKFWKSSLLESKKFEISLSSSNAVISLIDLIARSCAFPFRCFLAFWIAWKQFSRLCIWLFSCSRRANMLAGSSLGNSTKHALGTRNPCHRQNTSNSHLFSYRVDHGDSATVNSRGAFLLVGRISCRCGTKVSSLKDENPDLPRRLKTKTLQAWLPKEDNKLAGVGTK